MRNELENIMNKREQLVELYKQYAVEDTSYFEYSYLSEKWSKSTTTPNIQSNLDNWRLVIPLKIYEPKIGEWYVNLFNNPIQINNFITADDLESARKAGIIRETKGQAEELAKILRETCMLHAWACENRVNSKFIENECSYSVMISKEKASPTMHFTYKYGVAYMTKEGANSAAKLINSGELVL